MRCLPHTKIPLQLGNDNENNKVPFLPRDILPRRGNENQLSPAIPHSGSPDSSAHTDSLSTFKTVENI